MAKIEELTDRQLVEQIEKYGKVYEKLIAEKKQRILDGKDPIIFQTEAEKKKQSLGPDAKTGTYHIAFSDTQVKQFQETHEAVQKSLAQDEVAVTKLLQLSKEQLDALKKDS